MSVIKVISNGVVLATVKASSTIVFAANVTEDSTHRFVTDAEKAIWNAGAGASSEFVFNETPAGLVNGSNATFTTAFNFVAGKVTVTINGLIQKIVTHFQTVGNTTITFNESPITGDLILVNYIKL